MYTLIKRGHFRWCPHHTSSHEKDCWCKLWGYGVVIVFAMALAALEFWGSAVSGSLALHGDAWHVVSDLVVYSISAWAFYLKLRAGSTRATQEIDARWGLRNSAVLMVVAGGIFLFGCYRLFAPVEILSGTMLTVAAVGLFGNFVMLALMHALHLEHDHHSHGHHDKTHRSAIYHTLTDTLMSLIVVAVALLMRAFPEHPAMAHLDSVGAVLVACLLFWLAHRMRKQIRSHAH